MTRALVISGGGSKGAFAVGAVRHMVEQLGLTFDLVAGTSTGALISPLVVADELALLERVYTSVKTSDILADPSRAQDVLSRGYFFDTAPLEKLVKKTIDATIAQRILDSPVPIFLATVCLQTGRLTYFQTGQFNGRPEGTADLVRVADRATLISAVVASSNQPILMPPIAIGAPAPLREYVDGGVREYAPISVAIANDALEVYVILHSPPPATREPQEGRVKGMIGMVGRAIGLLVDEVGDNDLRLAQIYSEASQYLETIRLNARGLGLSNDQITQLFAGANPFVGRRPVRLHVIRPESKFPTEGLTFDPKVMKQLVAWGRRRAEEILG